MLPETSLETRDLRLVQAIADAGSVTAAAKRLALSQSALSHQIKNLEERLGVQVFERRGRGLGFTQSGERLLMLAGELLAPLARAEAEIRRASVRPHRTLRLSTQCNSAYHWLPQVHPMWRERHPDVSLRIEPEKDAAEALRTGQLDLALCLEDSFDDRFRQQVLFDDELVLVLPPGHPLAGKQLDSLDSVIDEVFVLGATTTASRRLVQRELFPHGGGLRDVIRMPSGAGVLEMVKHGLGLSIQANWAVAPSVERGELAVARLNRRGLRRRWRGVYAKESALAAPIKTLLSLIKRHGLPTKPSPRGKPQGNARAADSQASRAVDTPDTL